MNFKKISLAILAGLSLNAYAGLKVGGMSGPEGSLLVAAQKIAKEKYNLDVEVIHFDDFVTPNIALSDGDIDLNAFQHRPYLNQMVRDRGFKLVVVGNTFVYPIGAYSKRIKALEELKDGKSIALPNDPSNRARSLILLHKKGIITLEDPNNLEASLLEIKENPHDYKFVELDAALLPRMLDEVDLVFINSVYATNYGLSPADDAVFSEDIDSPYMNVIVAREEDKDKEDIKNFVKAFQSNVVNEAAKKAFKGAAVAGFSVESEKKVEEKAETKAEDKTDVKTELKAKLKAKLKAEIKSEIKAELKAELKN